MLRWSADAIESFVIERIKEVAQDETIIKAAYETLEIRIAEEKGLLGKKRKLLASDIGRLSIETRRLVESLGSGISSAARKLIENQLNQTGNLLADSEKQMQDLECRINALNDSQADFAWVVKTLKNFEVLWQTMTLENRQRLVLVLVREVVVNEATDTATVVMRDWTEDSRDMEGNARNRQDYRDQAKTAGDARA